MSALTRDGLVHVPARGPSGPTTACGRIEQVYIVADPATCPNCPKETGWPAQAA